MQAIAIAGAIAVSGSGIATAAEQPPVPPDATHLSLTGKGGEELARGDVRVRKGLPWQVVVDSWVTDSKADSRCVYLEYKIITAFGFDKNHKVRVCGIGHTGYKLTETTKVGVERFDAIEMKLCREDGWSRDPCTITTIRI